jgi:hypothetical protein
LAGRQPLAGCCAKRFMVQARGYCSSKDEGKSGFFAFFLRNMGAIEMCFFARICSLWAWPCGHPIQTGISQVLPACPAAGCGSTRPTRCRSDYWRPRSGIFPEWLFDNNGQQFGISFPKPRACHCFYQIHPEKAHPGWFTNPRGGSIP